MSGNVSDVLVDVLATHRITRFVTEDQLFEPVRKLVWKRFDPETTKIGYFVTCPHCVSIWAAGVVVLARSVTPDRWDKIARVLALSAVAGLVAERL